MYYIFTTQSEFIYQFNLRNKSSFLCYVSLFDHYGYIECSFIDKEKEDEVVSFLVSTCGMMIIKGRGSLYHSYVCALIENKQSLSVAESCTGGRLSACITSQKGVSQVFRGGVISYSSKLKHSLLGVSAETLEKHGPVSEESAIEMAYGARNLCHSEISIAVTGVCGPDADERGVGVGVVYIACIGHTNVAVLKKYSFSPQLSREDIAQRSVYAALFLSYRSIFNDSNLHNS